MICARAASPNAVAVIAFAAHASSRYQSVVWGTAARPLRSSDFRPFCPADRAAGDQPLDVRRTIAEIGEHSPCVGADARDRKSAVQGLAIERGPTWHGS